MLLYLKIKPNQRYNSIKKSEDGFIVRIRAPAEDGKANSHLIEFMANTLKLPKSAIRILKGQTSRYKCIEIDAAAEKVYKLLNDSDGLHNSL